MLETLLRIAKKFIPRKLFRALQPIYHYTLSLLAAFVYRFPSREVRVIGITGTKGKSTTAEFVNGILEAAGFRTALLGTIRFKVGNESEPNLRKMTIPGRFFVQRFLRKAVSAKCDWVILEMTSESVLQYRHKWIALDALIFTNLAPEHIESHGSFEIYRDAKLEIAKLLTPAVWPKKQNTAIIANMDNEENGGLFLNIGADRQFPYRIEDAYPYELLEGESVFTFKGSAIKMALPGLFNISNALGAATFADSQNIAPDVIKRGLESIGGVRGRVEYIREGQPFDAIVDYAHTPDSLEALYGTFKDARIIAVLGNTGGGRDTWKRPTMAGIAEKYANHIFLTNEDPYDESPQAILDAMLEGITDTSKAHVIIDRREALRAAFAFAHELHSKHRTDRIAVLITGKGTDPYIMGANGHKTPWDDATVAREELRALLKSQSHA